MPPFFNILKDEKSNTFLNKNGFIICDALTESQLRKYRVKFNKWHNKSVGSFYKSYFSDQANYKADIENEIIDDFNELVEKKFQNCQLFGGMYVVKPFGNEGHLPPHQDWSFVDEQKHWSLNMWCPLQDVNATNGNMLMLPGSHSYMKTIRGSKTKDQYLDQKKLLDNYMLDQPMKAGQAIFFFHGIIHGSKPNKTVNDRVSLGLSLIEQNAPVYYHYYNEKINQTEVFKTDTKFYQNYVADREKLPDNLVSLGLSDFEFDSINDNQLIEKINTALEEYQPPNKC